MHITYFADNAKEKIQILHIGYFCVVRRFKCLHALKYKEHFPVGADRPHPCNCTKADALPCLEQG